MTRHERLAQSLRAASARSVWVCDSCYNAICHGLDVVQVNSESMINFWNTECDICGYAIGEYLVAGDAVLSSHALDSGDMEGI